MSEPTRRNRLGESPSPYLRQHADNPVHWQPWDETALEAARERDIPIFLSIGYAACHWCHVMAEESFADPEIAAVLNDDFVPIKVDREERPDVDEVYMNVHQLVKGGGGWPLSVFLTPDLEPFYVGTYLPPEPRRGQTGFKQLCEDIAEAWADPEERRELEERATQWTAAVTDELESVPAEASAPSETLLDEAVESLIRQADREYGGFGTGQKFPQPGRIGLLFRAHRRSGDERALTVAKETLDAMANGGLRDHLGGGFHRYCTDREWVVPHFEKMLYDNAELTRTFLAGYRVTGTEEYAEIARETLGFLDDELRHPDGGYFSSLDARSGDEEGRYYVWTPDSVRDACRSAALEDPDQVATVACRYWGITEAGDVEGRSVLTRADSVEAIATETGRSPGDVQTDLDAAREAMLAERDSRDRPPRDEKILAGWNGLVISAEAEAALTLGEAYGESAARTLAFIRDHHWDGETLYRRWRDGDRGIEGYLEDYAFLARGALDTFQATGQAGHLKFALSVTRALVDKFYDAERETLYTTGGESDPPLARPQELRDRSTPASMGVAIEVLLALDHVAQGEEFGDIAERVLNRHGETISRSPSQFATMVGTADRLRHGIIEVTIAGSLPEEWRRSIGGVHEPDRVIYHRPARDTKMRDWSTALGLNTTPSVWDGRDASDNTPTAYVCRRSCSPPLSTAEEVVEWMDDFA